MFCDPTPTTATHAISSVKSRAPTAFIIGAGLAGCALANRLAARGVQVTLVDALPGLAHATSGNRMGAVQPLLARGDSAPAQFTRAAYFYTLETLQRLAAQGQHVVGNFQGLLHLAKDEADAQKMQTLLHEQTWPTEFVRWVHVDEASALAGVPVARGGYWFPQAGWLQPASYCAALINEYAAQISLHFNTRITQLDTSSADCVVLANAYAAMQFAPQLKLHTVRGQVSYFSAQHFQAPRVPVAGDGYVMPAYEGISVVGATYEHDAMTLELRASSHQENEQRLERLLPGQSFEVPASLEGRAGLRTVRPSRLPLLGAVPGMSGVYVLTALGSRGITWVSLCAEVLAAQICGEAVPLQPHLLDAVKT